MIISMYNKKKFKKGIFIMNMARKKTLILLIIFLITSLFNFNYAKKIKIAVGNYGGEVQRDSMMAYFGKSNIPICSVTAKWPVLITDIEGKIPPSYIPAVLETDLQNLRLNNFNSEINQLKKVLKQFPNIKYIILKDVILEDKNSPFYVKKISTAVRGIIPEIKIGIHINFIGKKKQIINSVKSLIGIKDVLPYYNAIVLPSFKYRKKILNLILNKVPNMEIWQSLADKINSGNKPEQIISSIIKLNPFAMINTSLLIITNNNFKSLFAPLGNLLSIINLDLYKYYTKTKVKRGYGKSFRLDNYINPSDQSVMVFYNMNAPDNLRIYFKRNSYKRVILNNLLNGKSENILIKENSKQINLLLKVGFYAINLIPIKKTLTKLDYNMNITSSYMPTADEIIAKVRIWKDRVRTKLNCFTARMSSSLRLSVANINEVFDLTISGPIFSERDKPYDWVWKEFHINGVKWKGKKVPKIPLLQPEKVNVLPMDLLLSEEYVYSYVKQTKLNGYSVYVIKFKPKKEYQSKSTYYGTLWIDKNNYFIRKEHLIQINLKGEVLSNIETRFYKQVGEDPEMLLPLKVKGHQVFSTVGKVTSVEKEVIINQVKLNPPDFSERRDKAYKTDFQMVRDTNKGMRYLVKDKKSKKRRVEWETKKSQLLWVMGGYFDSSRSYPLPIIGVNYMNFNLGGKGRQVNVMFGGVVLTANYSDPSLFGSKIDLGANMSAIALPFNNSIYRNNKKAKSETVKKWPFFFKVNFGFPLGPYLKSSSTLFVHYNHFSNSKYTSDKFTIPQSTFTYGFKSRLIANFKGYKLLLLGSIARRGKWNFWGFPNNKSYDQSQQSFYRWRFTVSKNFFLSGFRKFQFMMGYYDGINLDRFSAYKFGFFNEVKMRGFMSGVVQATRAYLLKLSYGYSIGKVFRLELSYDSSLVTNKFNNYKNTYFSSAALSGTVNIPGVNMICRFEAGLPIYSNNVKGYVLNLILMKML